MAMSLRHLSSYDDYLDEKVSETDMRNLGNRSVARELIEFCQQGVGRTDLIGRGEFELEKARESAGWVESAEATPSDEFALGLEARDLSSDDELIQAIAEREVRMREGAIFPIVFVRHKNRNGHEVSAFIDLVQRVREGLLGVANEEVTASDKDNVKYRKKTVQLMPRRTDLSYFDWRGGVAIAGSSPNFDVVTKISEWNGEPGLAFRSKVDGSTVCIDLDDESQRGIRGTEVRVGGYEQIVFFDVDPRGKGV